VIVLLCLLLNGGITDAPLKSDARQNLQSAYNIKEWGVFSKEKSFLQPPAPDNYREPLPPAVTAAFLYLLGDSRACLRGDCGENGFNARAIKKINLVWACIALCAGAFLSFRITGSRLWTTAALVLMYLCFLRNPSYVDSLYTEIPASACMLLSALCLMKCFRRPGALICFATGTVLGCLVLVKAIFLYILAPLVAGAAVFLVLHKDRTPPNYRVKSLLLLCLGLLITIGPWAIRNQVHFGSLQISSRGGLALYTRALINQMDVREYRASFHYWGPGAYRRLVRNTILDINDRDYEPGGSAVRLNCSEDSGFFQDDIAAQKKGSPGDALSFYSIARAHRVRAGMDLRKAGHPHADLAADNCLRSEALAMIAGQPLRHLLATLPLAWRGMWCFYGGGMFTLLCAAAYASFVFVCAYGAFRKRWDIIAFAVLPFFLFFFNAMLTNNLPRFNAPAIPFMVMSMAFAAQLLLQRLTAALRRGTDNNGS
jgi:hypothetical protein